MSVYTTGVLKMIVQCSYIGRAAKSMAPAPGETRCRLIAIHVPARSSTFNESTFNETTVAIGVCDALQPTVYLIKVLPGYVRSAISVGDL